MYEELSVIYVVIRKNPIQMKCLLFLLRLIVYKDMGIVSTFSLILLLRGTYMFLYSKHTESWIFKTWHHNRYLNFKIITFFGSSVCLKKW